jgi:hypothetical protein
LHVIHKVLKAKHAAGELTDEQFAEKAIELLDLILESGAVSFYRASLSRRTDAPATGGCGTKA